MGELVAERVFEGGAEGGEESAQVCVLSGSLEAMAAAADQSGARVVEVTIIRPGDSNNRYRYRPEVLREAVPLFEGAAAFCDHPGLMDAGRAGGRSLRDLVGVYEGVRWDEATMAMRGNLRLYPGAEWMATMVRQAMSDREAGRAAPNVGISADMLLLKTPIYEGNGGYGRVLGWDVKRIVKVNSADVVFQPSAGGRFERILEGAQIEGGVSVCQRCNQSPCTCAVTSGTATEGAPVSTDRERISGLERVQAAAADRERISGSGAGGQQSGSVAASAAPSGEAPAPGPSEISRELEAVRSLRLELSQTMLAQRLAAAGLPGPAMEFIRGRLAGRVVEAAEVDAEIASVRNLLGGIVAPQVVQGMGPGAGRIVAVRSPLERVQLAMDRLFGLPLPDAASEVPRFSGIREAYIAITGDAGFTGRYHPELSHVLEADEVTTSIMANIVASSMTKKLVADYAAQPKWWLPFVSRVAIRDMKVQDRILLYDFGAFPTVAENDPYVNLAWDDMKETYTPAKKGSTVYITLETIINDDLRAVARIPAKLAVAAAVTINEFVAALFTANSGAGSTMADSKAVFHNDHGSNLGTTALSSTALKAALIAMAKQTNAASKRIGVVGRYLLVPPDLLYTAQVIAGSANEPGTANNDINVLQGKVSPISVPQFTDTNNWYVLADPSQIESIELGFLNGREEPELLVQDNPTSGTVFTNDAITYKVRWIFGGGWLDYRGAFGATVT